MAIILTGEWPAARRILTTAPARVRIAIDRAVTQEAQFLKRKIQEGLREQAPGGQRFRPLAESTLAMRRFKRFRGTKALLVRGDLRNSITVASQPGGGKFVGVLRTARGRSGQPLANIAELNEYGSRPIVIRVTPKMRRLLAAALGSGRGGGSFGGGASMGIVVVRIPARPFIQPVVDRHFGNSGEVRDRFLRRIAFSLNGDLGGPGSGSSPASSAPRSPRLSGGGAIRDPNTGRFVRRS